MLRSMLQLNPSHRLTSEEYLMQQRGKAFPTYFYTYLKVYLQNYRLTTISADERITRYTVYLGMKIIFGMSIAQFF